MKYLEWKAWTFDFTPPTTFANLPTERRRGVLVARIQRRWRLNRDRDSPEIDEIYNGSQISWAPAFTTFWES